MFDDFFKDFAPGFYVRPLHGDGLPAPSQIKVDVKETEGGFTVQAEVPGVPKEDIRVAIDGSGHFACRGAPNRPEDRGREGAAFRALLRRGVAQLQLPADIDAAQSKARYDNGILTLMLPKRVNDTSRRLSIE